MNKPKVKGTKELVEDIFKEHPEWNATQVYDRYKILLGDATNNARGLSVIQKHLAKLKPRYQELREENLDIPYTLSALKKLNVPALAVWYIISVESWAKTKQKNIKADEFPHPDYMPITLRQALWIAFFCGLVSPDHKEFKKHKEHAWIWLWSKIYSIAEIESKLLGKESFDSSKIDNAMLNPATKAYVPTNTTYLIDTGNNYRFMGIADSNIIQELKKDGDVNG
jgi:hypothetical protein